MKYYKKADLKVECIVSDEDFEIFGVCFADILDRTEAGMNFIKRVKELCAMTQNITWTNIAYTLNISMLPDGRVSLEFSECISDYITSLKHSMAMADEETLDPLKEFIQALEESDEEHARKLVARFEKSVKRCSKPAKNAD